MDGVDIVSESDSDIVMKVHEEAVGFTEWQLTILEVAPGPHYISTPDDTPFGIMVYAYDRAVSYAFPGGLNLVKE